MVKRHDFRCETAVIKSCHCRCKGAGHRLDFLKRAIEHNKQERTIFDKHLNRAFGARFTDLLQQPTAGQKIARSRKKWKNIVGTSIPTIKTEASQTEQRIVDTTMHDALVMAWEFFENNGMPILDWRDAAFTLLPKDWNSSSVSVSVKDKQSSFLWASGLAALSSYLWEPGATCASVITVSNEIETRLSTGAYTAICFPRQKNARQVQTLFPPSAMNSPNIHILSNEIARRAVKSYGILSQKIDHVALLASLAGSLSSADLWRHPAAVRYCLIPAIDYLNADPKVHETLSLKSPKPIKLLIGQCLETRWDVNHHW